VDRIFEKLYDMYIAGNGGGGGGGGGDVCWKPNNTQIFKVVYYKGLVGEKMGGSLNNIQ
jgi:hypothetical protein